MGYAFISYSTKNQNFADSMRAILNKNGIENWMAPYDIPVGSKYALVINRAIKDCACFILLLTNNSQNSVWVAKEVERAINYHKSLISVQLEDLILNDEFEFYISTDQLVRVDKIEDDCEEVKKMLESIISLTGTVKKSKPNIKENLSSSVDVQSEDYHNSNNTNNSEDISSNQIYQNTPEYDYSAYKLPPEDILRKNDLPTDVSYTDNESPERTGELIISTLESFGIKAKLDSFDIGHGIIRYAVVPNKGTRINKIESLADDICLSLAVESVRIEAPIPGRSAIGIEIPRKYPHELTLREMIESEEFKSSSDISFCLGETVERKPIVLDIAKAPHLIISGATGTGKSVCFNTLITSIIYKSSPEKVKFLMIDTHMVDLSLYSSIPHQLMPVIHEPRTAIAALEWVCHEMNRRFALMQSIGARNIDNYNEKILSSEVKTGALPKIIVLINELSDLMNVDKDGFERLICMLAQKSRAAGIHLVIGTQRPNVNVLTGILKTNIPTRIAFRVATFTDSRSILDHQGAERLRNKGDMLLSTNYTTSPIRVQGAYISDSEVENVVSFIRGQISDPAYDTEAMSYVEAKIAEMNGKFKRQNTTEDLKSTALLNDKSFGSAVKVVIEANAASVSLLQRKMNIGYNRAAQYIDIMEYLGVIGPHNGRKPRTVLFTMEDWIKKFDSSEND